MVQHCMKFMRHCSLPNVCVGFLFFKRSCIVGDTKPKESSLRILLSANLTHFISPVERYSPSRTEKDNLDEKYAGPDKV